MMDEIGIAGDQPRIDEPKPIDEVTVETLRRLANRILNLTERIDALERRVDDIKPSSFWSNDDYPERSQQEMED